MELLTEAVWVEFLQNLMELSSDQSLKYGSLKEPGHVHLQVGADHPSSLCIWIKAPGLIPLSLTSGAALAMPLQQIF